MKQKNKIIIIITTFLFLLLMCYNLFPNVSDEMKTKEMLKKTYQIVLSYINENSQKGQKLYLIKNNKLEDRQSKIVEDNDISGIGKIIRLSNGDTYGYIQYNGQCMIKNIDNKYFTYQQSCPDINEPLLASDLVSQNSNLNELKEDTIETGLNTSLPFSSKKYFVGKNPSNYLVFSKQCWRIVNIAQNDALKIVYEAPLNQYGTCENISTTVSGSIGLFTWDRDLKQQGNWQTQSSLKMFMDLWQNDSLIDTTQQKIKLDIDYLTSPNWYIGNISESNQSLLDDITDERETSLQDGSKLGLLNNSDYLKINCNKSSANSNEDCAENNYLYKKNYNWWTINTGDIPNKKVWLIMQDGNIINREVKYSHEYYFSGVRITAYLDASTKLIGLGTEKIPYQIVK